MRKLLSTVAAIVMAGGVAYAANVPLFTGIADPGNIPGILNQVIQSINTNAPGIVAVQPGPVASIATTVEQNLASAALPAGVIGAPGQTLRLRCGGLSGSNGNTKAATLYYGTSKITTGNFTSSAETWILELLVTNAGTQPDSTFIGQGAINTTVVAPVASNNTTDNLATSLTAKCTATQGTASAADMTLETFLVEQVK